MLHTALYNAHTKSNAKFCDFAGYQMPITYPLGNLKEHEWVRQHAGLFDVSHMGQAFLKGANVREFVSHITPSSFLTIPHGHAKYTVLTNEEGGIIDDLIFTCVDDETFFVVYNAGCKEKDEAWITQQLPDNIQFDMLTDRSLIALQGPEAEAALCALLPEHHEAIAQQAYMTLQSITLADHTLFISRLGYTGEDGFELSIPNDHAESYWQRLCEDARVEPIGLAARDSLRQEMGYPLYGNDINDTTTPIEAGLAWLVTKTPDAGYIGESIIAKQRTDKPARKRVGIVLDDRGVPRADFAVLSEDKEVLGTLTSGVYSPQLGKGIGQAYVPLDYAAKNTVLYVDIRGKHIKAHVAPMPFVAANTKTHT